MHRCWKEGKKQKAIFVKLTFEMNIYMQKECSDFHSKQYISDPYNWKLMMIKFSLTFIN